MGFGNISMMFRAAVTLVVLTWFVGKTNLFTVYTHPVKVCRKKVRESIHLHYIVICQKVHSQNQEI